MLIRLLLILPLFFLLAMGPVGGGKDASQQPNPDSMIGNRAPDFSLKDMNNRTVTLSSLRGKVVLLNFWATWCPPCKAEMPSMNRLYKSLKQKGFEVIAVSTDTSLFHVKEYLNSNHFDFIVAHDEQRTVSKQYKVFSMPATFLIDRNGMIIEKFYGEYDWTDPEIRKQIEKLL
jgi:peroxiredoxin